MNKVVKIAGLFLVVGMVLVGCGASTETGSAPPDPKANPTHAKPSADTAGGVASSMKNQ